MWSVVRASELTKRGWSEHQVRVAVRERRLRRVGPGLLLVSDEPVDDLGWEMACAALALRYPDGAISGEAAAALHGLDGFDPGVPLAVQLGRPRSARGGTAIVHRRPPLRPFVRSGGMSVTDIDETLLNLGADATPRAGCRAARQELDVAELVELAVECALHGRLTTVDALHTLLAEAPRNRHGRSVLRQVLTLRGDLPPTESYLETRLVQVLRAGGLPEFERQVDVEDRRGRFIGRVDFRLGPVVIECLGRKDHDGREDVDLARIADLTAAGLAVLPFRFAHIEHQQHHVLSTTSDALRQAGLGPLGPGAVSARSKNRPGR